MRREFIVRVIGTLLVVSYLPYIYTSNLLSSVSDFQRWSQVLVIQKYGTRRTEAVLERFTTTIIFQRTFVTSLLRWGLISISLYFSLGNLSGIIFTVNIRIVCVGICNCVDVIVI